MLLVRNSVLLATEKQIKKADKLELTWSDLFSKQTDLVNTKTIQLSEFPIDMSMLKKTAARTIQSIV
jgi:hypothetical protein